jgi:hypothetical protein
MWHVQLKAAPVPSSGSAVGTTVAVGGFIAQSIRRNMLVDQYFVVSVLKKMIETGLKDSGKLKYSASMRIMSILLRQSRIQEGVLRA